MKTVYFLLLFMPILAFGETYYPYQARAIDGDTLEILVRGQGSERVRLLGIDAPESRQDFGNRAKQALAQCINNGLKNNNLRIESHKQDRYHRSLGVVYAGDTDCNLNQLTLGLAWHYKHYASDQPTAMRHRYAQAELVAYSTHRGLWASCATAPWRYRRGEQGCDVPDFNQDTANTNPASPTLESLPSQVATPSPHLQNQTPDQNQTPNQTQRQILSQRQTPSRTHAISPSINGTSCSTLAHATCKQMSDCATARLALACGNTRIDGDKDGVPCEAICR